jgi:hypothetical protein
MHGEDDQIVPVKNSARKSAKLIKGAVEIYYPGLPHGVTATHADLVTATCSRSVSRTSGRWRNSAAPGGPPMMAKPGNVVSRRQFTPDGIAGRGCPDESRSVQPSGISAIDSRRRHAATPGQTSRADSRRPAEPHPRKE